jgi:hypothetical protein
MQISDIWPFLLPGILLQLLMQILCIAKGVREDNRKPFHRTLYVLSIAIFGLAAIAFHLLRAEKTPPKDTTTAEVERANHLTNKGYLFPAADCLSSDGVTYASREFRYSDIHPLDLAAINFFSHNAVV